jgi:endonuclease/exonuclease/phosphatase family metal-dependent hydrolase
MKLTRRLMVLALLTCTPAFAQDAKQPALAPAQQPAQKFGLEKANVRTAGTVRIASYNIENLFDDKDDPSLSGKYEDKDMTKAERAMQAAAAAIKAIDADVLALQEVESKEALLWFRDKYLTGMGYEHVASIDAGDERGIEQSVLSRFPIVEAKNWAGMDLGGVHPEKWGTQPNDRAEQPIKYHRSPLVVDIEVPGPTGTAAGGGGRFVLAPYTLTLVVSHHKSGRDGEYWREKEAAKSVELLGAMQNEDAQRNIVWLGDFNAILSDASMKLVTAAGWYDVFVEGQKGSGGAGGAGGPGGAGERNDPAIITHASGRIIDHILLNAAARKEYVAASAFVLGTPIRGKDGYASDHNPVVIDLTSKENGASKD